MDARKLRLEIVVQRLKRIRIKRRRVRVRDGWKPDRACQTLCRSFADGDLRSTLSWRPGGLERGGADEAQAHEQNQGDANQQQEFFHGFLPTFRAVLILPDRCEI